MVSQFRSAEMIAEKWDISREEMEQFALHSHQRAIAAIDEGRFKAEIEPVGDVDTDEGPRRDTSPEKMAGLKPLAEGGRITAAVASQISDAASAMLIASERAVKEHGLTPRARVHHLSVRGDDPVWMLTGPIPATRHALERTGLSIDDIDVFEVNEAFATQAVAVVRDAFVESDLEGYFNGHPAVNCVVYKTSSQDAIQIATLEKAYVAGKTGMPFDHYGYNAAYKAPWYGQPLALIGAASRPGATPRTPPDTQLPQSSCGVSGQRQRRHGLSSSG